jgi:ABC-type multidrug transport system fused ATPase/permease subunit
MYAIRKFWGLAASMPRALAVSVTLIAMDALFIGFSVMFMAPLADLLLERPESQWIAITRKTRDAIEFLGLDFTLLSVAGLMWLSMLLASISSIFVRITTARIKQQVIRRQLSESYQAMEDVSWEFFVHLRKGRVINTFMREINKIGTAFHSAALLVANFVRIGATIAVPLWVEPVLVAVCVAGTVVALFPFLLLGRFNYAAGKHNVETSRKYSSLIKESLDGAKDVLAYGRQRHTREAVLAQYDKYAVSAVRSDYINYLASQLYEPVGLLVIVVMLYVSRRYGVVVTELSVVLWGMLRTVPLLKQLLQYKHTLDNLLPSYEQIQKLLRNAERYRCANGARRFEGLKEEIAVRNLTYAYGGNRPSLEDVSLVIRKGQVAAIVGESGSGKSTLLDIIVGLLTPGGGEVLVDGVPLQEYERGTWRERIGLVVQKPVLFDLTIRENLVWSNPEASEDDLWEACRLAGADGFVRELPRQLDTEVGENGIKISGGQAQRLALARALVRRPDLLILDEATSALDLETERDIIDRVYALRARMTVLVVTHRPSTIRDADVVYVLERGRVVEQRVGGAGSELPRLVDTGSALRS